MKRIANYLIALAVAAFTFTSCADVPSPFGDIVKPDSGDVVVIEPSGTGTEADPYNVAAALELVTNMAAGVQSDKQVYIKGYVTEISDIDISGNFGNATYYISDNTDGTANRFYIYRGYGLGGKKFNEGATPIKVGDLIIIKSKVVNYQGNTPETVANDCSIVELNGTKADGTTPATTLGTKDAPLTVAQALETINALADNGTTAQDAYVTGKITKIKTADTDIAKYKNIDYIISDGTNELTVFRGKNVDNTDFTEAGQINVGDEVVVIGKLTKFVKDGNTTPEVAQGNYIVKLTKGSSGGDSNAKGTGTQADPFNIAAAIAKCKEVGETASTEKYYIKGIVVKGGKVSGGYGNVSFDMGDTKDATDLFKAYQVAGTDGEKLADGYEVKAGDEVVIYGPVVNYKGNTPETPGKSAAQIVTINGKKTNEGSSSANDGSQGKPFNIAEAIAKCKEVGETASTEKYYIKGIVVKGGKVSGGYGNVSFDMGDTKDATDLFKAYQVAGTDGEKLADGYEVKAGDEVVIYGPVVNYKGNTPETPGKSAAQIVTINGKKTSEGGSSGGNTGGGEIKAAFGDLDCSNIAAIKLSDGTTLSVSQEDGKSAPIYHENTKIIRIYARNAITINAGSKKIAKVVLDYDTYNGTAYKGNDEMYGEAGSNKITPTKDSASVTFSNVNNSSLKVVNWLESGNSGGTQFRITGITITYAN